VTINDGRVACRGKGLIDRCMLPLILQFLKVELFTPSFCVIAPKQVHVRSSPPCSGHSSFMLFCRTTLLVVPTTFLFVTVIVVGGGGGSTQPRSESGVRQ
jgi:hypothetical protein